MQHGVLLEEDDTTAAAAADDFPFDADADDDDGFLIADELRSKLIESSWVSSGYSRKTRWDEDEDEDVVLASDGMGRW